MWKASLRQKIYLRKVQGCKACQPRNCYKAPPPPLESVTPKRGSKERGVGACAGDAVEGVGGGGKGVVEGGAKGVVGGGGKGVFGGGGVSCVSVLNPLLKRKKLDKGEGDKAERRQHAAICGARVNASEHSYKKVKTK